MLLAKNAFSQVVRLRSAPAAIHVAGNTARCGIWVRVGVLELN
jgi:hypothetical protein